MNARTKLAGFGVLLATAFGVGAALGAAFGPAPDDDPAPAVADPAGGHDEHED